jgi:hypothetical protein
MTIKIEEFKAGSERNELIAIEVANEVVGKLKLAIERVEAKALT